MKLKYCLSLVLILVLLSVSQAQALEKKQRVFFFDTTEMPETGGFLNQSADTRVGENALLDNNVLSIAVKEPYVYFGTHVGVSRFDLSNFEFKNYRNDTDSLMQTVAAGDSVNGTVWVGRAGGFSSINDLKMDHLKGSAFDDLLVYSSFVE